MAGEINVGIAGWSYADWKETVYPPGKVDELVYVSQFVDVIEINSSFYRVPTVRMSESWLRRTRELPGFFFTAKLHQDITHHGKLGPELVGQFRDGFEPLVEAGRLRHLLAQFRYDFADTDAHRRHVAGIVDGFSGLCNLVVEVRHRSWQSEEALRFLDGLGVTVCNLDYPTSSNSFDTQTRAIGSHAYLRMHGRNAEKWFSKAGRDETYNYYYSNEELQQIVKRSDSLAEESVSLTVIANNHYRGAELANALEIKAIITGKKVDVPERLLETYPRLAKIASAGQGQLGFS